MSRSTLALNIVPFFPFCQQNASTLALPRWPLWVFKLVRVQFSDLPRYANLVQVSPTHPGMPWCPVQTVTHIRKVFISALRETPEKHPGVSLFALLLFFSVFPGIRFWAFLSLSLVSPFIFPPSSPRLSFVVLIKLPPLPKYGGVVLFTIPDRLDRCPPHIIIARILS